MNKFEVGQKIGTFIDIDNDKGGFTTKAHYDEYGDTGPFYGEVTEVLGKAKVKVKFEENAFNEAVHDTKTGQITGYVPVEVAIKALLTADETKAAASQIERDFKKVEKEIQDKLKVAAQAIRDANKLSKKELGQTLCDMGAGYGPLYNAMDAAGWHTSSFDC